MGLLFFLLVFCIGLLKNTNLEHLGIVQCGEINKGIKSKLEKNIENVIFLKNKWV